MIDAGEETAIGKIRERVSALSAKDSILDAVPIFDDLAMIKTTTAEREDIFHRIKAAGVGGAGIGKLREAYREAEAKIAMAKRSDHQAGYAHLLKTDLFGIPKGNETNALVVLRNDPDFAGLFAYDEFLQRDMITRLAPWDELRPDAKYPRPMVDSDITNATGHIQSLGVDTKHAIARNCIMTVSKENRVNSLTDYLNSLVWDGVPRLERWLPTYAGTRDSIYECFIGSRFLISAIARAFDPGCQVDTVLVSKGPQGAGKSALFRALAGIAWFLEHDGDLGNKDFLIATAGKWIVEFSEMSAFSKSETEKVKAFITKTADTYRAPYGTIAEDHPRQCVFCGTTNHDQFLSDETGGRRFWIAEVGDIRLDDLKRDRDQLWAEAVHYYRAGMRWYPVKGVDDEFIRLSEATTYEAFKSGAWEELIDEWLRTEMVNGERRLTDSYRQFVTINEVMAGALGMDPEKRDQRTSNAIGVILRRLGYTPHKPTINGVRLRGYEKRRSKI